MPQTKEGARKAKAKLIEQYGEEGYSLRMASIGRSGGLKQGPELRSPKGFAAMSFEKRSAAGKKGGSRSKRGPAKVSTDEI